MPSAVISAFLFGAVCLAAVAFWALVQIGTFVGPVPISYSEFERLLGNGSVKNVLVSGDTVTGEALTPFAGGKSAFTTERVPLDLAEKLDQHRVEFSARPAVNWDLRLTNWLAPPLLFAIGWLLLRDLKRSRSPSVGGRSACRSKAKLFVDTGVCVNFDHVAGIDEAKAELREIVDFLKDPGAFTRLGARVARGTLLVGPPGTGKTLLARAVAGEAGVPFYATNGSEFVEMYVGVGAARVRDLFEQARQSAPCIIFIDELDALGRARSHASFGGNDEKEATLNQLLAEMDGFDRSAAVIILAATNRPEILDPALVRPGRFDRQISVDPPDQSGRIEILKAHTAKLSIDPALDCVQIAALTSRFTGADLANLANEAAILATRRGADRIMIGDFVAAIERIVGGLEMRSRVLGLRERRIVAIHEMGHALVARALPGADPVQKVSIIRRGIGALGHTLQRATEDRHLMGRRELIDRLTVLLSGRAAEALVFDEITTGAANDLATATALARDMVERFGMDAGIGLAVDDTPRNGTSQRVASETAREIDLAVRGLLDDALERATGILRRNLVQLKAGAELLLQQETLDADQLPVVALEQVA